MYRMRVFLAIAWALALGGIGYAQGSWLGDINRLEPGWRNR